MLSNCPPSFCSKCLTWIQRSRRRPGGWTWTSAGASTSQPSCVTWLSNATRRTCRKCSTSAPPGRSQRRQASVWLCSLGKAESKCRKKNFLWRKHSTEMKSDLPVAHNVATDPFSSSWCCTYWPLQKVQACMLTNAFNFWICFLCEISDFCFLRKWHASLQSSWLLKLYLIFPYIF